MLIRWTDGALHSKLNVTEQRRSEECRTRNIAQLRNVTAS